MSLELTIKLPGADQNRLKTVAQKLPKAGKLEMKPRKSFPVFGGIADFRVEGVADGLAPNSSERGDFLQFNEETRKTLAELFRAFGAMASVFTVYAAQSGDLPKRETTVTIERLTELVQENHLGNRVTYWVRPEEVTLRPPEEPATEGAGPDGAGSQ